MTFLSIVGLLSLVLYLDIVSAFLRPLPTRKWEAMVINLDRRPDRLQNFTSAVFEKAPEVAKKLCRLRGIDGRSMGNSSEGADSIEKKMLSLGLVGEHNLNLAKRAVKSKKWNHLSLGAIGLYLAHAEAWQRIVDRDLDFGLVFEDDLVLYGKTFDRALRDIEKMSLSSWDWVYLQSCKRDPGHPEDSWPKDGAEPKKMPELARCSEIKVPCTGLYAVSRAGARKLMRDAFPIEQQLDLAVMSMSSLARWRFVPPVAQVSENHTFWYDTDVQDYTITNHVMAMERLMHSMRAQQSGSFLDKSSQSPSHVLPECGSIHLPHDRRSQ